MKSKIVKIPFLGRAALVWDKEGEALEYPGGLQWQSNLTATLIRNGKIEGTRDLGSGMVTNVGTLALCNDWNWTVTSGPQVNILKLANWHVSGKGTTGAAITDIKMETISTNGGQTPVAGTQSNVIAANLSASGQVYKTVATISYTGGEAVTEWGLINSATLSATTGSPATTGTATQLTSTGTSLTASSTSVQGMQNQVVEFVHSATNYWGLVLNNTTSAFNVGAWYQTTNGQAAGLSPVNTDTYTIRPVLWDRKTFSAINVVNLDSVSYSYSLTLTSGG